MARYEMRVEIFEGRGGLRQSVEAEHPHFVRDGICAWMYHGDGERSFEVGDTFEYPGDAGKLCPFLLDSLRGMATALTFGGELRWQYPDTPYVKEMDPDGVTTEFVRCPDPSRSGIVVKLIRTKVRD